MPRKVGDKDLTKRKSRKDADATKLQPLKDEYLAFFRRFPVQAAAADFIGRSPDAVQIWAREDPWFKEEVQKAKAAWATKNFLRMRPDNLLMFLYPDLRPPKQEIEQTGDTSVTITYVHPTDTNRTDPEAGSDLAEAPGQNDN